MGLYTSLGVTVSPVVADGFIELLENLEYEIPDQLARTDYGAVTAVWQNRKHFNAFDSDTYCRVMDFLEGIPENLFSYENITESYGPEIRGSYGFNFSTYTTYDVYGKPLRLGKKVLSKSRKQRRCRNDQ